MEDPEIKHTRGVPWEKQDRYVRLFLAGDIMAGRAVDQMFPVHNPETFGKPDHVPASQYRAWSEALHGGEYLPVQHDYVWGSALGILDQGNIDFRLANLEVAVTTSDEWAPKGFNFRMHPANIGCLSAAALDCCALANNHILDFGEQGLKDTLTALSGKGIGYAGAGLDGESALRPYTRELPHGARIVVHSWGARDSGIPSSWGATEAAPGLNHLADYSEPAIQRLMDAINNFRRSGDITVLSIHWGGNWIKRIPDAHRELARRLIDQAGVDVIHGHSSHHPLGIEKYRGKLILYGCGDLINDYEGNPKYRSMKHHLGALYFADLDIESRTVQKLRIVPVQRRRFRLEKPSQQDSTWVTGLIGHFNRMLSEGK